MRYKILFMLLLVIQCFYLTEESVQGPPEDNQKRTDETENKETDGDKTSDASQPKTVFIIKGEQDGSTKIKIEPASSELSKDADKQKETIDFIMLNQAKIIEKMVKDFEILNTMDESDSLEAEELPPVPESAFKLVEPTEEEQYAKELYETAASMLNKTKPDKPKAYEILVEASNKGSLEAKALVAWAKVFGNPMDQDIVEAREMFQDLVELGHPDGHMGIGFLYATGLSVNVSQARALVHYTFAALGGNTWGQMALGYRYWSGATVSPSCEKSLDFYRQVADKVSQGVSFSGGAAIQRVRLLDELENGYTSGILDNDLFEYYQLLAEKGDVQAQVGLGQLHYQGGRGVDLDYQKAMHYFTQAANAGNAMAMAYLGKIYLDGSDDVQANNDTAFKYFKKASELNNPVGLSGLGLMYLYGKGVEKDYTKAYQYFQAAADQGWVDGQLQLGNMYFSGLGVKKDFKMANKYFSLASQSGHVLAYYNLAQMHAKGTGMLRSCTTAVELFKNVAERGRWGELLMAAHSDYRDGHYDQAFAQYAFLAELGYEVAQSNTAFLLDRNEVPMFETKESLVRALLYWGRAASQGYSAAQVKLGDYYYYGLGTSVDYETAASQYRIAAEQQHNAQAMFNLGFMHERGLGMSKDIHLAKRCYDMASETSVDAKVPVALALFKLNFEFSLEHLKESHLMDMFNLTETFGTNWDLYLITTLIAILAGITYFRRPQAPPAA